MRWSCEGMDITYDKTLKFDLVIADHDGQSYTYQALEKVVYDGVEISDIDISAKTVDCAPTDKGQQRLGQQYWDLKDNAFSLFSGCENESIEVEATCKRVDWQSL